MNNIIVSAPGKLHLLGEHVVVYGKPAILTAINKRLRIKILSNNSDKIKIVFKNSRESIFIKPEIILDKIINAEKKWLEFKTEQDIRKLKGLIVSNFDFPILIIGEVFLYFNLKSIHGFDLEIDLDIPVGSGLGSSASLAVAVTAGLIKFLDKKFDKEIINRIAYSCEKLIHGNPSGGDNTIAVYGGLLWYRKETNHFKIIKQLPLKFNSSILNKFDLIFTGKPDETTGEMVSLVNNLYKKNKNKFRKIFDSQENLTRLLIGALENNNIDEIKRIIFEGENNLELLKVVSRSTRKIISKLNKMNIVSKISGAGGVRNASGVILVFNEKNKDLNKLLGDNKFIINSVKLGEEGVRIEHE